MKSRKNNCDLAFILPDKNYLSLTFWHIIQVCPIGYLFFIMMMTFEELVKVFLVTRLAFEMPFFEQALESLNNNSDIPQNLMITSVVLILYHLFNLVVIWYLNRTIRYLPEQNSLTTTLSILMKYIAVYFSTAITFFTMLIHIYMIQVLYLIFGSEVFKNQEESQIINLVLIVILILTNLNNIIRPLSLVAIALLAYLQLFRCTYFITYYNEKVNQFLQMMIEYEEQDIDEENLSYYKMINEIYHHKYGQDHRFNKQVSERIQNIEQEYKNIDAASMEFTSGNMDSILAKSTGEFPFDKGFLGSLKNGKLDNNQKNQMKTGNNINNENCERGKSSLYEVFSNDTLIKKQVVDENKKEQIFIKIEGQTMDVTNSQDAIQTGLSDQQFAEQQISYSHNHNQYSCSLIQGRLYSYISKSNHNDELDTEILLNQSLKIDEILNYIKDCTDKIMIFWQLMASENISKEQIEDLLKVSFDISIMLKQIKHNLKMMTSADNFQSSCHSLYFYLCHFYNVVLRDNHQSQVILKHMMNMQSVRSQSSIKNSLIDDVGLTVVDGNFSLFGRMIFANKTISKLLGYKSEELINQRIHILMPGQISEVHNKFWLRFAECGAARVLEQVRFLFVKDKEGYIAPFKMFMKFLYHKDFGYCFISLFRRPKSFIFDDQESQVRTRKTYQLICSDNGKILEISRSCQQLMKLRPDMLDKFQSSFSDSFTLSHLNSQLQISTLDFNESNCYFYRYIGLNFGVIWKMSKMAEFIEDSDYNIKLPRNQFKAQMKIIRETYGDPKSAQVSIYYVIFSEFNNNQNTMHNISGSSNNPATRQTIQSLNNFESHESDLADSENLFFSQKDDKIKLSSINGKSMSTESLMGINNNSISSSYSSSQTSDQYNEIKYIEEGIDYEKNPKPLIYLRLAVVILLLISLILSTIQFALNIDTNKQNIDYQKMLARTLQAEESISSLVLLTRCYLNVNLNLENNNMTYVNDRKEVIKYQALEILENTRINMKILQQFINQIQEEDTFKNHFSDMSIRVYDLYLNKTVGNRKLSRFYTINDWLVKIGEIFYNPNLTSKIYSFYPQNFSVNNADQLVFYVLTNSLNDIRSKLMIFNNECESFIKNQVIKSNFTNQIYVIITSIVIVVLTLITQYYLLFLNQFKYQVLDFFTELEKETILLNEQCAIEFSLYLKTENYDIIKKNQNDQREYEINKSLKDDVKQQQDKIPGKKLNSKQKKGTSKFFRKLTKNSQGIQSSSNFSENLEDDDEKYQAKEEKKENHKESNLDSSNIQGKMIVQSKQNKGNPNKALATDEGKIKLQDMIGKSLEEQVSRMDLRQYSQTNRRSDLLSESSDKNKYIVMRLKELKMKKLSQMFIVGTLTSFILIIYFVVQFLLFEKSQNFLNSNSEVLKEIQQSLECTSTFLFQVRDLQTSNQTTYLLDSTKPIQLQQVQDMQKINILNETYKSCINHNQYVNAWIQEQNQAEFYLNKNDQNICTYLDQKKMFGNGLNLKNCKSIYQGILNKNVLYQTSLFLQDSYYHALKFGSLQDKTEANIKQIIGSLTHIELLDSVQLYQQYGLRRFYDEIFHDMLLQNSAFIILLGMFVVFTIILVIGQMIVICYVTPLIRNNFWNAFYILKLLPKDELDREFIKKINEFLSRA
ncbi:pas domain s-box family protein [Stylonychia lemnae]|uniref:Pas domain s-box family protein n=1 Tax=Stylonychia lemnae TaxID=5949 RepID=A0A078A545_STYLE|nr:pas domain s-box family protein [Stylonychia lemnae]|eukprot:CDW75859.1 pas domain s-box family protein [Stylonychia lemnae]